MSMVLLPKPVVSDAGQEKVVKVVTHVLFPVLTTYNNRKKKLRFF